MAYQLAYSDQVHVVTTWEWNNLFALRSVIWPAYLSIPLHVLRFLKIDSNFLVCNSIIFMNSLIQALGDYFLYYLAHHFIGVDGAKMSLVYSLFNRRINEIFQKTLTNGAEAVFSTCGLYYYFKLKPQFDHNMRMMTLFVTLAFLVRSSSLTGWLPLALHTAFSSLDYFLAVLAAGVFVAVPIFGLSVFADSLFYGKLTCPQVNFVYINVVENIAATFGKQEFNWYINELKVFITENRNLFSFSMFAFCFFAVSNLHGKVPLANKKESWFNGL
jgi:hypothetical protein